MNSARFPMAYWMGTRTPMGSSRMPMSRTARSGSLRKVASNRRPTNGRNSSRPTPAGATANPRSRASSSNSSSKKNDWIEPAGNRAKPMAAKAMVILRMVSMFHMRVKAASTEIAILSSCLRPAPSTCFCSHWPRGGSLKKKAKKAKAAVGSPRR